MHKLCDQSTAINLEGLFQGAICGIRQTCNALFKNTTFIETLTMFRVNSKKSCYNVNISQ